MLLEIIDFINKGGLISWILIAAYIFIMSISLERLIFFVKTKVNFYQINTSLQKLINDTNISLLKTDKNFLKYKNSQCVKLINYYMENKHLNKEQFNEALDREAFSEISQMEKGVWILSQIGHIAPLLGLLGTVIGLIESFQIMAALGAEADVASFASGIWVAMITTAIGLTVAIPSFFIFRIFEQVIEKRSKQITNIISILNQNYCSECFNDSDYIKKHSSFIKEDSEDIHESF